ncbi:LuxR C-terminal-related transcriptional regulator [Occultella gossypii]|nr:LuxR C-terminal-related transcriptional regulator [Occultella gossypii]
MTGDRQGRPEWTIALPDRLILHRDRLIARLAALSEARVSVIWAQVGAGKSTLVRAWANTTDRSLYWLEPGRSDWPQLVESARQDPRPATLVLREPEYTRDRERLREVVDLLGRSPDIRVMILGGTHWNGRIDPELEMLRATAVMRARELCFTSDELAQLAVQRGIELTAEAAACIQEVSGGVPLLAVAALQAVGTGDDIVERVVDAMGDTFRAAAGGGVGASDPWDVVLLCSLLETFTIDLVDRVWPGRAAVRTIRAMRDLGLVLALDEDVFAARLVFTPSLSGGLRRQALVELDAPRFDPVLARLVDFFAAEDRLDLAIDLFDTYGQHERLADLLSTHWLDLGELPADRIRTTMDRAARSRRQDGRLLIGHARAIADITHEGHSGHVTPAERRYATALLDSATTKVDAEAATTIAATATTRGAIARAEGRHRDALAAHRDAMDALSSAPPAPLGVSAFTQAGLTELSVGDIRAALRDFSRAAELAGTRYDTFAARYARALSTLAAGVLERPQTAHRADEPQVGAEQGPGAPASLARALARLRVLDLPQAWDELRRVTEVDDPLVLHVLRAEAEGFAHVLANTPLAGLESLDLLQARLDPRLLSGYERDLLLCARADLLTAAGEPDQALALIDAAPPKSWEAPRQILVRARILLALGRPQDAVDLLQPSYDSSPSPFQRFRTPTLVAATVGLLELGEEERAESYLERALAVSARSWNMLPFAMHGISTFGTLIQRAEMIALEPTSTEFVAAMAQQRDRLRLASMRVRLTGREQVLLQHLQSTRATRRLAAQLHVSPNTVKSQLQSIYRKFSVSTREEALNVGRLMGLLPAEDGAR